MSRAFVTVYTTFPDLKTAKSVVNGLVKKRIAACGNIFRIYSIYRWRGKIEKSPEYGALIKTRKNNYRTLERYLKKNHPYKVPEIIAWNIEQGQKDYLSWITEATKLFRDTTS
jgi:periplasmic divalent cation tolerance protein